MNITIQPAKLKGALSAPDSKSHAHRLLIAAALSAATDLGADMGSTADSDSGADMGSAADSDSGADMGSAADSSAHGSKGTVVITDTSEDLEATENCLHALLGWDLPDRDLPETELQKRDLPETELQKRDLPILDCGESGSTLRFLLPLSVTASRGALFYGRGKLPDRPLNPLDEELEKHGAVFSERDRLHSLTADDSNNDPAGQPKDSRRICRIDLPESTSLKGGEYTLPGHISSQYVTGLLMALPLIKEDSCIRITTPLQSAAYIDITLAVLRRFGITVDISEEKCEEGVLPVYHIKGGQKYFFPEDAISNDLSGSISVNAATSPSNAATSPSGDINGASNLSADRKRILPEGDWSNGAFWLVANALGSDIDVSRLDPDSPQGDKKICDVIQELAPSLNSNSINRTTQTGGASVLKYNDKEVLTTIDAGNIPDLVPVISVLAALTPGKTRIVNAQRLRIKESDRLKTTCAMLTALGASIKETEDGLMIHGKNHLTGGEVDGAGDHRIVMSAAIAATCCSDPVTIRGAEAAAKSYPRFFDDYEKLGGRITIKQ